MAVTVTLNTKGLDALLAGGFDAAVEVAVVQVATAVYNESQTHVPVRTGYLKASGAVEPAENRFSRYIHYSAPYAAYLEFGTRYMTPRAYLMPALEVVRSRGEDMQRAFVAELQRLAGV